MHLLILVLGREVETWEQGYVAEDAVEKSCFCRGAFTAGIQELGWYMVNVMDLINFVALIRLAISLMERLGIQRDFYGTEYAE